MNLSLQRELRKRTTTGQPPPSRGDANPATLTHGGGVLRLHLVEHSHLARLSVRILVHPKIFLGHLVDVLGGSMFRDLRNTSANLHVAIRILGIHDGQRSPRVATNVLVLLTTLGRIENY